MDKKQKTIESYEKSAKGLGNKFDDHGARVKDIQEVFSLIGKENPKVLEIGCGNGRDAKEIIKLTNDYFGIDISQEMINLARERASGAKFEVADVESFVFPKGIDIVIAFASLIHCDTNSLTRILSDLFSSLNEGGLVRLSLKFGEHKEVTKTDEFGSRTHYTYTAEDIKKVAPQFVVEKEEIEEKRGQKWLEITLRK